MVLIIDFICTVALLLFAYIKYVQHVLEIRMLVSAMPSDKFHVVILLQLSWLPDLSFDMLYYGTT